MYLEIFKQGELIKRGNTVIGGLSWDNELMTVPSLSLTLPAEYEEYLDGREDIKVAVNDKVFWGHLKQNYTLNKDDETISMNLDHVVAEWEYRQISVNNAITDGKINVVFKGDKVNKKNGESITANDFSVRTKDVKKGISDKSLIRKAGAQAWNTISGDPVKIAKVDKSKLKAKEGDYDITFSTAKGLSVTVKATVSPVVRYGGWRTNSNGKTTKEKIKARRFTIDIDTAEELTDARLKKLAKAEAWVYRHRDDKLSIPTVISNVRAEVGSYTVKFKTAKGTEVTIDVTVEDSGEGAPDLEPSVVDNLSDIYNDMNFAYPGWELDWQGDSGDRTIDYVYSRQNKLEALTKTIELTEDLFWRVGFTNDKKIEIGVFGEKKPIIISTKPSGITNRRMITEPEVEKDYENVINVATVYSDKSHGGMSSVTLREVYNNKDYQIDGFPVVILRANVNNERDYTQYVTQFPKLAPNNQLEYAIIDVESVALESGILIEGTYAFNDLGSFNTDSKKITDARRIKAARTVYKAGVRKLKNARRNYKFKVTVEEMPPDVNVGDKVRVLYDNSIWNLEACSSYYKKLLQLDDWYYIERMTWDIDATGNEVNELTLSKFIRVDRDTDNEQ